MIERKPKLPDALYVHIPFCTKRCHYCAFTSFEQPELIDRYLKALEAEFQSLFPTPQAVASIYLGGGTPTLLSAAQLESLGSILAKFTKQKTNCEFTVEANPETVTEERFTVLKEIGVNRLSLGVQSFNPQLLKKLGRKHTLTEIYRAVELANKLRINNFSLDLMLGLPAQTVQDVISSLQEAVRLNPMHLSCYLLKVEAETPFARALANDNLELPTESEELASFKVMQTLTEYGLKQYELSNFARPGYKSKHNLTYWLNNEYYGLGCGAHGYVAGVRYANTTSLMNYLERPTVRAEEKQVSQAEQMENFMIMGLRLLEGVSFNRFYELYNRKLQEVFGRELQKLAAQKLLKITGDKAHLTSHGLLLSNEVFVEFVGCLI
ncbi:MAG: hypothetical protein RLZ12_819 [Bacillota bacterium]